MDLTSAGNGYLAKPVSGNGPGVLVLHAWWGLTPFLQTFCDRLAGQGFVTLAPDLYHGALASTVEEAKRLRGKLKRERACEDILQAAERLRAACGPTHSGMGVVGFSLGGYWALWLAEQAQSGVAATVVYYGTRNGDYTASRSAFQFHLAETDEYVSASGVKAQQKNLKTAGREAEFHVYAGTTHWFFESDRPDAFNPQAADLAWSRTLRFLKDRVG